MNKTIELPIGVLELLEYSFMDINFEYSKLTEVEKECITEEEFNLIVDKINKL